MLDVPGYLGLMTTDKRQQLCESNVQQQFRGELVLNTHRSLTTGSQRCALEVGRGGLSLLVGGPGLSQRPVIWHGGEERVPQLAVDEEHNEQHQEEEQ